LEIHKNIITIIYNKTASNKTSVDLPTKKYNTSFGMIKQKKTNEKKKKTIIYTPR